MREKEGEGDRGDYRGKKRWVVIDVLYTHTEDAQLRGLWGAALVSCTDVQL